MVEFTRENAAYFDLGPRELQLVALIEEGYNRHAIARKMGLTPDTVRQYTSRLCEDYDCPGYLLPDKIRERAAKENLSDGR